MYQEIEEKLNASNLINFLPYVGQKYLESKNKILVLGESHYGPQETNDNRNNTRAVFEEAFATGYLVTDFVHDQGRSFYVLTHGETTL